MKNVLLIISLLILIGCAGTKRGSIISTTKDSTVTTITKVPRNEIITVPGDSIKIRIPVLDLTEEPIVRRSDRAVASIRKVGNDIEVDYKCEQYLKQIEVMDQLIETQRELIKTQQETIIVPERFVPWYIKILATIGGLTLIGLGIIVGINIGKRTLKPL